MTPTEELMMEVLAARWRLGESLWTFSRRPAIVAAAKSLEAKGFIWVKNGIVEKTFQAALTEEGRSEVLDPTYVSPAEKKWLQANPENIIEAVRQIVNAQ